MLLLVLVAHSLPPPPIDSFFCCSLRADSGHSSFHPDLTLKHTVVKGEQACECACVCVCVCVSECACVCVCVRMCVCPVTPPPSFLSSFLPLSIFPLLSFPAKGRLVARDHHSPQQQQQHTPRTRILSYPFSTYWLLITHHWATQSPSTFRFPNLFLRTKWHAEPTQHTHPVVNFQAAP